MKRWIVIALVITSVLMIEAAARCATATVTLKEQCEVRCTKPIRIKDIASVEAPEDLANKIREIVVGSGPPPGSTRTINSRYIRMKVASACKSTDFALEGPGKVSVTGKCIRISSQDLADAARDFLATQLPNANCTYEIVVQRMPRELVVRDYGAVEVRPRIRRSSVRTGPNTVVLDAVVDGQVVATTSASLQVNAVADVLVAAAAIRQGEPVSDRNTTWEQRDITKLPTAIIMGPSGALDDWVARRTLRVGRTIRSSDVELPPAIRRGDTVTLTVRCGKVTLRTTGEAKQQGRVGDSVRVRSSISKQDVRARIVASGQVEINR